MTFDTNSIILLSTGAIISSAMMFIGKLRQVPSFLFNKIKARFVYTAKVYQYDELFMILENYMYRHYKSKYRFVEASIEADPFGSQLCSPEVGVPKTDIFYRQEQTKFIIQYGGKKIFVEKDKEKQEKTENWRQKFFHQYTLSGFKAKNVIDMLLKEALSEHNQSKKGNKVKIYTNNNYGWDLSNTIHSKSMEQVIIQPEIKEKLISDIKRFSDSESWYLDKGIPYKRGYCLHGAPGNGKTSLAVVLANLTDRDICSLDVNSFDGDKDLRNVFANLRQNSILLIEDIDKIFDNRDSLGHKISFSAMLNCLDGTMFKHGMITIITTNHIEKLDAALLRDGRIDLKIEIPNPRNKDISEFISRFYEIPMNGQKYKEVAMSTVQETCIQNLNDSDKAIKLLIDSK